MTLVYTTSVDSLNYSITYQISISNLNNVNDSISTNKTFYTFDTTQVPNGNYSIIVRAYNEIGNISKSSLVFINIRNNLSSNQNTTTTSQTTTSSVIDGNSTSNHTSNSFDSYKQIITTSPGFELIYPILILSLGFQFFRKRKNQN